MINVKPQIVEALSKVASHVFSSYPTDFTKLPAVSYEEEENSVYEWADDREQKSTIRYRIDIYDKKSVSDMAIAIDGELSKLGLHRIQSLDVGDPNGWSHKSMRYEGIIDVNNERMYFT